MLSPHVDVGAADLHTDELSLSDAC